MFMIPAELPARLLFIGFSAILGAVLVLLAIVFTELLYESEPRKTKR